jgi:aldehyde dehydrogenase (NAD(P)+)
MEDQLDKTGIDETLQRLGENKDHWAHLSIRARITYLEQVRDLLVANADAWVAAGVQMKDLDPHAPIVGGEEWLGGPYPTAAWLTEMIATLTRLSTGADPLDGVRVRTRPDGQVVAGVFPSNAYDRLLLNGYELDVWMQPDVSPVTLRNNVASFYRQSDPQGAVTLVLGAGNVAAIPMLDVLYCLYADGHVVVLKMNPVNEVYGPVFERILAPLIRDGYVAVVYGGADVGKHLTDSDLVDTVHITGSERTYETIVFGSGAAGRAAKQAGTPRWTKPIRSELGGASPTIVVPGPWSKADIAYQAQHLATQKLFSAGHTCVASQVLILPAGWEHKDELLDALRAELAAAPDRRPFYPGTEDRQDTFRAENPDAEALPGPQERTLLVDIDPDSNHPAFQDEMFGPIYVTTSIEGTDAGDYLAKAVEFANKHLHGNLGANIIIDPTTAGKCAAELDRAIADLKYGCIGVNVWSAFAFLSPRGAWGAYPGNTPTDIQSGTGVVHNALLFDKTQKTVVRAPFRPFQRSLRHPLQGLTVKPPWFLSNRTARSTARAFTMFAADPHPKRLPSIFIPAVRG